MGFIGHHAIIVTSWDEGLLRRAHERASSGNRVVTPIAGPGVNGYSSFLVAPDGSKEGWEESYNGDAAREALKQWMMEQVHEDGSSSLEWVEVYFGHDPERAEIQDHPFKDTGGEVMGRDKTVPTRSRQGERR